MTKEIWLIFLRDPATGGIECHAHFHNCVADYRGLRRGSREFVGYKKITIDMEELER